jgi:hypothetical protein
MIKKLHSILALSVMSMAGLVNSVHAEFSVFNIEPGLGLELPAYSTQFVGMGHSGMAHVTKRGLSLKNPSKQAFNTYTNLEVNAIFGWTYIEDNQTSNTLDFFDISSAGISFPLGRFGNLSGIYYQRFDNQFDFVGKTSTDPSISQERLTKEGGPYALSASYSIVVHPRLALGVSYQSLLGNSKLIRRTEFQDSVWRVSEDTVKTTSTGHYFGFSATFRTKTMNFALTTQLPSTLEQEEEHTYSNQQASENTSTTYDFPLVIGTGFNYKFAKNKNATLDVTWSQWDKKLTGHSNSTWQVGAGYEYRGNGGPYRPYYTKMTYRTGLGYEKLYIQGINVYRATVGLGLPIGRRQGLVDLALEGGTRGTISDNGAREQYLKAYISVTGAGAWGKSSR